MPIYDYQCERCGRFESRQKITDSPLLECPECGNPVHRLISKNIGIVFKGSGFYKTDNSLKDKARALNKERQVDNQAILDGDVKGFVEQSERTDKKAAEAHAD